MGLNVASPLVFFLLDWKQKVQETTALREEVDMLLGEEEVMHVSGARDQWPELQVVSSLAALAAHGGPAEQRTFSVCLLLVLRHQRNVLAGLSVQIHSKLIFVSSMGNLGQDLCCAPFS